MSVFIAKIILALCAIVGLFQGPVSFMKFDFHAVGPYFPRLLEAAHSTELSHAQSIIEEQHLVGQSLDVSVDNGNTGLLQIRFPTELPVQFSTSIVCMIVCLSILVGILRTLFRRVRGCKKTACEYEREIERLKSLHSVSEEQIRISHEMISGMKEKENALQKEIYELENVTQNQEEKMNDLQNEIRVINQNVKKVNEVKAAYEDDMDRMNKLVEEKDKVEERLKKLNRNKDEEIEMLKDKISRQQADLLKKNVISKEMEKTYEAHISELERKNDRLKTQNSLSITKLEEKTILKDELIRELQINQLALQNVVHKGVQASRGQIEKIKELENKIIMKDQELERLNEVKTAYEEDIVQKDKSLKEKDRKILGLQGQCTEVEERLREMNKIKDEEMEMLNEKISDLSEKNFILQNIQDENMKELENEIRMKEQELEKLREIKAGSEEKVIKKDKLIKEKETEILKLQCKCTEVEERLRQLNELKNDVINELHDKLSVHQTDVLKKNALLKRAMETHSEDQRVLGESRSEIKNLKGQLERQRLQFAKNMQKAQKEKEYLENLVKQLKRDVQERTEKMSQNEELLRQKEKEHREEVESLQTKLVELKKKKEEEEEEEEEETKGGVEPTPETSSDSKHGLFFLMKKQDNLAQKAQQEMERNNFQESVRLLTQALELGKLSVPVYYHLLQRRGFALVCLSRYEEALQDCKALIASDKRRLKAYFLRAYCNVALDRYTEAISDFKILISFNHKVSDIYATRAQVIQGLFAGIQDYDQSLKVLGLTIEATEAEVKSAYRRLSLAHHPDKHPQADIKVQLQHQEIFKVISTSVEKVLNPKRRGAYQTNSDAFKEMKSHFLSRLLGEL